ncbi:hypothetical protein HPB47_005796 [Ixodes persulcatus]|uniref:Uncharacterized protein n=1 Tax=Ixodes persulcatus TaxID=34615 RepID=A0AC60PCA7_IXOPE|nr:hypothetical protein HPB47_005796 [Ixodes persulcatus]
MARHVTRAGLQNEAAALKRYKTKQKIQAFGVGLCINPGLPMLGASPDGLVWDEDIQEYELVEVKNVSQVIDVHLTTFEEVMGRGFVEFIYADKTVDKKHKHYHQVAGQLALTGLEWHDLAVDWVEDCWVTQTQVRQPALLVFSLATVVQVNTMMVFSELPVLLTEPRFSSSLEFLGANLAKCLKTRFPDYKFDQVASLAMLLDPRFKAVVYEEDRSMGHWLKNLGVEEAQQISETQRSAEVSSASTAPEVPSSYADGDNDGDADFVQSRNALGRSESNDMRPARDAATRRLTAVAMGATGTGSGGRPDQQLLWGLRWQVRDETGPARAAATSRSTAAVIRATGSRFRCKPNQLILSGLPRLLQPWQRWTALLFLRRPPRLLPAAASSSRSTTSRRRPRRGARNHLVAMCRGGSGLCSGTRGRRHRRG